MYSQKWNCAASLLVHIYVFPEMKLCSLFISKTEFFTSYTHLSVRDLYISRIGLSILLRPNMYVDRSWEYINRSQTHACRNWDWGRTIPSLGINKLNFRYSVARATLALVLWVIFDDTQGGGAPCYLLAKHVPTIFFESIHMTKLCSRWGAVFFILPAALFFKSSLR